MYYLYVRVSSHYNSYNAIKLGITESPVDREETYITYEIKRGHYIAIFQIDCSNRDQLKQIEKDLLHCLTDLGLHVFLDAGVEFFHQDVIQYIIPFFQTHHISYKQLSSSEIEQLIRKPHISEPSHAQSDQIVPRNYQIQCIDQFKQLIANRQYFQGLYELATGLGKTLIELNMCLEHLKLYPQDNILWITYKNEIVDSQLQEFTCYRDRIIICNHGRFDSSALNSIRGKIIIVLRQSLINQQLPSNSIHGVIYDECQDASKITDQSITYHYLATLKDTQPIRYRIGFSATPLTSDIRQNIGILNLYGGNDQVNYLFRYNLIDGVKDGWLNQPMITYIVFDPIYQLKNYLNSDVQDNKYTTIKIMDEIIKIINNSVYKKGIVWFPSSRLVKYFYQELRQVRPIGIDVYYSLANYNKDDQKFKEATKMCLMLACEKFTTGYNGVNLEFGINLVPNESGYLTVQKLGRFTRPKPFQGIAYLYQFCDNSDSEQDALIKSLTQICQCVGIDETNIDQMVTFKTRYSSSPLLLSHSLLTFDLTCTTLTFDQIKYQYLLNRFNHDLQQILIHQNQKIIETNKDLRQLIANKQLIDSLSKIKQYIDISHIQSSELIDINQYLNGAKRFNWIKYCVGNAVFAQMTQIYYNTIIEFTDACHRFNIRNIAEYKVKCLQDSKLPPYRYIKDGFYLDLEPNFNLIQLLGNLVIESLM